MIKTKMIQDGVLTCDTRLDDKINEFIKNNNIKVVDIKFTSVNNRATALIIYEVEEENDNNICNTCKLNNQCPIEHKPNLQCPYNDYENEVKENDN